MCLLFCQANTPFSDTIHAGCSISVCTQVARKCVLTKKMCLSGSTHLIKNGKARVGGANEQACLGDFKCCISREPLHSSDC